MQEALSHELWMLQALRSIFQQRDASALALVVQPWSYHYKRLILAPSRAVRAEASAVMGQLAAAVGKQLLPHLKSLLGAWWMALFDPYADVAATAKKALQDTFPGAKQAEAVIYCRYSMFGLGQSMEHHVASACKWCMVRCVVDRHVSLTSSYIACHGHNQKLPAVQELTLQQVTVVHLGIC